MLLLVWLLPQAPSETPDPRTEASRPRRGATAMEYLFMISLILVVVLSAVNYFGQETKKVADQASEAIQKATSSEQ